MPGEEGVKRVSRECQGHAKRVSRRSHESRGCQDSVTNEHCVEGVKRASRGSQEGVKRELREHDVERVLRECWICCFA